MKAATVKLEASRKLFARHVREARFSSASALCPRPRVGNYEDPLDPVQAKSRSAAIFSGGRSAATAVECSNRVERSRQAQALH